MSAAPVIRAPDENKGVMLRGDPMVFLVTGADTKHTSMFGWTIPAGFATGLLSYSPRWSISTRCMCLSD